MAHRLYRTTRSLYTTILDILYCWQQTVPLGTPTQVGLIALYVTGLILLDCRSTQTRVATFFPARCHDALNRLLRVMPVSTRQIMRLLIAFAWGLGCDGYLCVDDVIVEKAFAKKLSWASWTYSHAKGRHVYGRHIVVLLWCSHDKRWRIPVAFRLWRPKTSCSPHDYRKKTPLAAQMMKEVLATNLRERIAYIVGDGGYTAGWLTRLITRLDMQWNGILMPQTNIIRNSKPLTMRDVPGRVRLKWRKEFGVRASRAITVYAPSYGTIRVCVVRMASGTYRYLASNNLQLDVTTMLQRKYSRWDIETTFRDEKQYGGLESCQCWGDQAMVRHVALVMLTFVLMQRLRVTPTERVAHVKERCQLSIYQNKEQPPEPLRACPSEMRSSQAAIP
jgi:hypothetical protein